MGVGANGPQCDKHKQKPAVKGALGQSLEVQAANLLLSTMGVSKEDGLSIDVAAHRLGDQFGSLFHQFMLAT
jgi:hypothetical protein